MMDCKKRFLLILLGCMAGLALYAQFPKHEVRAAWVTAVYGLDWPRTRATTPEAVRRQQAELTDILDRLKAAHFNTVLFQTRTRGDVLYRSDIEPFNAILTGEPGGDPGYDPLAFAVEECHKRGMECHAWMVAIPLGNRKHVASLGKESVTKKHPDLCVLYKRSYYLNPGHPQAKEYLMSLVREVVERYDIDGVHFDYLRYPTRPLRFPDRYDFRKYDENTMFGVIYREVKSGKYYGKRSAIGGFILDKEYALCPPGCRLELLTPRADAIYLLTETGARNIDYVLAGTVLPDLARRILAHMAGDCPPQGVHLDIRDNELVMEFDGASPERTA